MQVVTRVSELRSHRAHAAAPVGLVATMGALHAGHAALIERARKECSSVVVSVFVNPLQFGPGEDFNSYPRNFDADRFALEKFRVDLMFCPTLAEMYPLEPDVYVEPNQIARYFEGERRPGHFRGVATVVLKLLHLVEPARAYFGQKDAQQLAVIKRMVRDLNCLTEIVACETVREPDGLALSSRNAYLSEEERRSAPNLHAALRSIRDELAEGNKDVEAVLAPARRLLAPLREDYLALVHPDDFKPLRWAPPSQSLLAIGAAFAGRTRLIDNLKVQTPAQPEEDRNGQSLSQST